MLKKRLNGRQSGITDQKSEKDRQKRVHAIFFAVNFFTGAFFARMILRQIIFSRTILHYMNRRISLRKEKFSPEISSLGSVFT
jgi:hypothetical protein